MKIIDRDFYMRNLPHGKEKVGTTHTELCGYEHKKYKQNVDVAVGSLEKGFVCAEFDMTGHVLFLAVIDIV